MTDTRYPHQYLQAYMRDRLGRRVQFFDEFHDKNLLKSMLEGLTDQLSIYTDMTPFSRLVVGSVRVREGQSKWYIMADLRDRGGPLRLRDATMRWQIELTDYEFDFVASQNARRWRFVERNMERVMQPLFGRVTELLLAHIAARHNPDTKMYVGLVRLLEGVDATTWCCDMDIPEDEVNQQKDSIGKYRVQ